MNIKQGKESKKLQDNFFCHNAESWFMQMLGLYILQVFVSNMFYSDESLKVFHWKATCWLFFDSWQNSLLIRSFEKYFYLNSVDILLINNKSTY